MKIEEIAKELNAKTVPVFENYKGYKICALPHGMYKSDILSEMSGSANGYIEIPEFEKLADNGIPEGNIHGGWTFRKNAVFGFDTLHFYSVTYMDESWVLNHLKEYIDEVLIK